MQPAVTVLVPNYNHARYLPKRLDSILGQTFQDFELIVLDDNSTDNSRDVLREYAGRSRMQLVLNEQNSGSPFIQWRRGAQMAAGKYLWIAESDDFAHPRLLEMLVAQMNSRPEVGLAYCQSFFVDEKNQVTGNYSSYSARLHPTRWDKDFVNSGKDEVARYLIRQNTIPNASAVLVKTDLLLSASEHTSDMRLMGDWWTWVRVLLQSDVAFVAEPLNYFRVHGSSVRASTKRAIACAEAFRVMALIGTKVDVPPSIRRIAVKEAFGGVWAYLDSPDITPDPKWLRDVLTNAKAVHWSAGGRLWYMRLKRQVKRLPFLTRAVRRLRRVRSG